MTYSGLMTYERTPEIREKNAAAMRGRKLLPESVAKRTATRFANGTYTKHGHAAHGEKRTPTYHSWSNMIQRCTNPDATGYEYYGGQGITICDRWLDFANFLADMGERPEGKTLDRIDGAKGYELHNCRWAGRETQLANRKRSAYYDRPARVNECGHPDRPHKARGMCGACYLRWRFSTDERDPRYMNSERGWLGYDENVRPFNPVTIFS